MLLMGVCISSASAVMIFWEDTCPDDNIKENITDIVSLGGINLNTSLFPIETNAWYIYDYDFLFNSTAKDTSGVILYLYNPQTDSRSHKTIDPATFQLLNLGIGHVYNESYPIP